LYALAAVPKNSSVFLLGLHFLLPQSPTHHIQNPRIIQICATTIAVKILQKKNAEDANKSLIPHSG
jgi:hypothetical protein